MTDSKIVFTASGHENILATHSTTLEFTRHHHLTKKGDCIIGVKANFSLGKIKRFLEKNSRGKRIVITIRAAGFQKRISAIPNRGFSSEDEMIIRKSDFISERTLAINSNCAAIDLSRDFIEKLKDPRLKMKIEMDFER